MTGERPQIVILGAGPAGLGAALQLARRGTFEVTVVERQQAVGGNAGSFELAGVPVDFGSHRLHPSCPPDVLADIRNLLGDDLLDRPRHGRIRLRGRWLHFPLKPVDLAMRVPPTFLGGVVRDSIWKSNGVNGHESFASVLERGLGRTICRDFYFPYARKIWGLAPDQLDAEQARRRVSAGSLGKMVRKVLNVVPGFKRPGSGRFFYPRQGFGQISEALHHAAIAAGATVRLGATVSGIECDGNRAAAVWIGERGNESRIPSRQVLSTIPLSVLVRAMRPAAPQDVLAAADGLQYRAMMLIYLTLGTEQFTPYDAHYFPEAEIPITRLSEPKNYSLTERAGTTVLCAELPCGTGDALWHAGDQELGELVSGALARAGLPIQVPIREVVVRRLPQAYPIYAMDYRRHFERLDEWVGGIDGLVTLGRQGLFAHDNTHHTLAMAYAACGCLDAQGAFDRARWAVHREAFESHVVED